MSKLFIYGMSVEGENFTDRELETKWLMLNFENGVNSILISPRRMGKTSLVRKHNDFGKKEVTSRFALGTRSNLSKLKQSLTDREIIETTEEGIFLSAPLFQLWFKREMM